VIGGAALLWVALEGRDAIERLLSRSLASTTITAHDRFRVLTVVPKVAAGWWPRATLVGAVGALGLSAALRLRRASTGLASVTLAATVTLTVPLAIELLAAPFLMAPLGLYNYFFVLDVDHRLPPNDPTLGTNGDGVRTSREPAAFAAGDENLIFLGDSFTYGLGVAADEAFPEVTTALLRLRLGRDDLHAANFGWISASPLLALRQLEDIGTGYAPDLVVYAFDMTDFNDDLLYRLMLERSGRYFWYDKLPITLRLIDRHGRSGVERLRATVQGAPRERFFATERPLEETRDQLMPAVQSLERLAAASRGMGAEFAVVVLPRSFQYSAAESPENWEAAEYTPLGRYSLEPFRFFASIERDLSFPVFSLLEAFQDTDVFPTCLPSDPHWNAAGHRVAAEAIADFLEPLL
jgi:hypothetical protein